MIRLKEIDNQLAKIGMKNRFWGRPEVRELCHILVSGEHIIQAVNGQYDGGFALLVATDRRLLLIDKKPWFLTMEDIRYDMISEVDYYGRLLDATVSIVTLNKALTFKSIRQARLRDMTRYIQHRVMQLRQQEYNQWQHVEDKQHTPVLSTMDEQPQQQTFTQQFQTSKSAEPAQPQMKPAEPKRTWTQALAQAAGGLAMRQAQRLRSTTTTFPHRPLMMRRRYSPRFYGWGKPAQ